MSDFCTENPTSGSFLFHTLCNLILVQVHAVPILCKRSAQARTAAGARMEAR